MTRMLDAGLHLLDRQLVDTDGTLVGKVDDLELTNPGDGAEPPHVTAILTGPGALAGRLRTPFARWLRAASALLRRAGHDCPTHVPFHQVEQIGGAIRLRITAKDLENTREAWVRDHLIGKIPGAGHAPQ